MCLKRKINKIKLEVTFNQSIMTIILQVLTCFLNHKYHIKLETITQNALQMKQHGGGRLLVWASVTVSTMKTTHLTVFVLFKQI